MSSKEEEEVEKDLSDKMKSMSTNVTSSSKDDQWWNEKGWTKWNGEDVKLSIEERVELSASVAEEVILKHTHTIVSFFQSSSHQNHDTHTHTHTIFSPRSRNNDEKRKTKYTDQQRRERVEGSVRAQGPSSVLRWIRTIW